MLLQLFFRESVVVVRRFSLSYKLLRFGFCERSELPAIGLLRCLRFRILILFSSFSALCD